MHGWGNGAGGCRESTACPPNPGRWVPHAAECRAQHPHGLHGFCQAGCANRCAPKQTACDVEVGKQGCRRWGGDGAHARPLQAAKGRRCWRRRGEEAPGRHTVTRTVNMPSSSFRLVSIKGMGRRVQGERHPNTATTKGCALTHVLMDCLPLGKHNWPAATVGRCRGRFMQVTSVPCCPGRTLAASNPLFLDIGTRH